MQQKYCNEFVIKLLNLERSEEKNVKKSFFIFVAFATEKI